MSRVLLNVPKSVKRGEALEVRVLISHPMESGQRKDEEGRLVPRDIIRAFTAAYAGVLVLEMELFPAIAANPFLSFAVRPEASGDLVLSWTDDHGATQTETVAVEIT